MPCRLQHGISPHNKSVTLIFFQERRDTYLQLSSHLWYPKTHRDNIHNVETHPLDEFRLTLPEQISWIFWIWVSCILTTCYPFGTCRKQTKILSLLVRQNHHFGLPSWMARWKKSLQAHNMVCKLHNCHSMYVIWHTCLTDDLEKKKQYGSLRMYMLQVNLFLRSICFNLGQFVPT